MTDIAPITRALISVSDKTGLLGLARELASRGVELLSTGGTAKALREAGFDVTDVSQVTQFPEMMDGRVKTLHPKIHGGLLALRDNPEHKAAMEAHGIGTIDLLCVNLYPFEETVAAGADFDTCIENIDIGGPAMIRAASKNHAFVTVLTSPSQYPDLTEELARVNGTSAAFRRKVAQAAFARTAAYDAAVSNWLAAATDIKTPPHRAFGGSLAQEMRYGENPHQKAAFYKDGSARPGVATAVQHQGKELSYNNINDTDAAFELASEFTPEGGPAAVIVKHANPCGVARAASLTEAYKSALVCDPTSAFGGIVALNQPLNGETAAEITKIFTEVVIAPGADEDARKAFEAKPNLRLLTTEAMADPAQSRLAFRQVAGGFLVQEHDTGAIGKSDLKVVTERAPSEAELTDLLFAWKVAKHVKSNAIVYAKNGATVGIGAGQMSRVDSSSIAASKAARMADELGLSTSSAVGSVVASDAFFPFADGLLAAVEAGATAVIQPGGSMRDEEVIKAANEAGIAMVFTGQRHFRH